MTDASSFRFFIATFGCKVSQYESQALREHWMRLGGRETDKPCQADVILVASCAVTAEAVADARQATRKWGREAPFARIVVTGCAASAEPDDFRLPGVTAVVPQSRKAELLSAHPMTLEGKRDSDVMLCVRQEKARDTRDPVKRERPAFPPFHIESFRRARPVLKVQDGCSHRCTYCIVPLTRGPSCSRPPAEAVDEARRLLSAGHREIMISGINLRQYHAGGQNFWGLLRRLNQELAPEWQGRARLRLSSLEPAQLDTEGLESLEACSLVCPHLHLSLQSGSPAVLRRMGRRYSLERILDAVTRVRDFWPVFGLGADILMGFPGENEEETQETLDMVQSLPLTYAHVFPWSSRPGTRAAAMPGILPKAERQEHAARVRALIAEKHAAFLDEQSALPGFVFAGDGDGGNGGVNEYYAPCRLEDGASMATGHELRHVRPVGVSGRHVLCRPGVLPRHGT
ncbi:MAG: MiaB/RimO family radical SAM methylthiotransferase [Desulfovibrionaceae bacterium]|nr:MiaB/RimO family radical SAM methylthiotransferase [Desulfovibrionaceae bacterium]